MPGIVAPFNAVEGVGEMNINRKKCWVHYGSQDCVVLQRWVGPDKATLERRAEGSPETRCRAV